MSSIRPVERSSTGFGSPCSLTSATELRSAGQMRTSAPTDRALHSRQPCKRRKISLCRTHPISPPNGPCSTSISAAWDGPWSPTPAAWTRLFSPGRRTRRLGSNMLAVIADSPSLARTQLADATAFAAEQGIPLEIIVTGELDRPGICPQRRFPLLPLQGRIVHRDGGISQPARLRFHRLRREPGRPGRLSSRAAGCRAASRGGATARGRAHQAGHPRTRPAPPGCASGTSQLRPACRRASSTDARSRVKR